MVLYPLSNEQLKPSFYNVLLKRRALNTITVCLSAGETSLANFSLHINISKQNFIVFGHSAVPSLLYVQLHSYQTTHQERKCNSLTPAQHINFSHIPFFLFCYSTQKVMTSARKNVCERNDSTAFSLPPIVRNMFSEA